MAVSASLRFSAKCPHCKVPLLEPTWTDYIDHDTVNFWHCPVCGFNFETINDRIIQSSRTDFVEKYFAHRLAA